MVTKESIKKKNMTDLAAYRDELLQKPRLIWLFAELTDCCNLKCLHCGSNCEPGHGRYLDRDLLLRTFETVAEDYDADNMMVCLTGGEPLLHPHFFEIGEEITRMGFHYGITTNATLIDADVARKLRKAHLGTVTVSLDGTESMHEYLRNTKGSFQKAVRGIKALQDEGFSVQVTTVFHKKNFGELEKVYEFMLSLGVDSWRPINIEPIGRANQYPELLLERDEILTLLNFIREKRFDRNVTMDVCYGCSHYLSIDYEREVRDTYFLCGAGRFVASILCNGDIYGCLDIERRPELVQGNIATDRFSDVWENRFREYRIDRSEKSARCRDCSERRFCVGDSMHTWNFDTCEPNFCFLRNGDLYKD